MKTNKKTKSLKEIRNEMKMTQAEFAVLLGKSRSSIAKKESGIVVITIDELRKLRECGIDLNEIDI